MKKLFAVLTALCLILASAAFAEEGPEKTYADEHPGVLAFDSYWVSGDAKVRIDACHTDGGYEIVVVEMTGENTFNAWEYLLTYDEETKSLVANGTGMMSSNVFDETGAITDSKYLYEDGTARFFINEDDQLSWSDEKESTFEATVFNRIGRFPGTYTGYGATMKVNWAGEGLIYDVSLDIPESETRTWHWSWSGPYIPAENALELSGVLMQYTYKDDGSLDLEAEQLEEDVSAYFTYDEEGCLYCTRATDPTFMGIHFELSPESSGMWAWEF